MNTPTTTDKRPNFFIVGAAKCGTTALYEYLKAHPQIFMSPVKEPNYFGRWTDFKSEAEYLSLFADARDEIRIGEASPGYLRFSESTEAIYNFDPSAKIIIMLRDPVSLIYSGFWQNRLTGREPASTLAEALARQETQTEIPPGQPGFYKRAPLFSEHVQRYFERFGCENVHVIIFDDLKQDAAGVYRQTLEFLGVDPSFQPDFQIVNARKQVRNSALQRLLLATGINVPRLKRSPLSHRIGKLIPAPVQALILGPARRLYLSEQPAAPIDPDLRRQLQAEFAPEVDRLSALLGRDLSHWYTS